MSAEGGAELLKSIETCKACIKVAACICAKDGVISDAELQSMYSLLIEYFPDLDDAAFENALDEFFDSKDQIEDYLGQITDEEQRKFILRLAEISAGADELEARENIALEKAFMIWGVIRNA